jgi:hypothetical protein
MLVKVEQPALGPRMRRRFSFVHGDLDPVPMQHAGKHQAAQPCADDGHVFSHLYALLGPAGVPASTSVEPLTGD